MSKDKTLEALKKSLQDNLQSIQDRDKAELNEEQKKELKDVIEKVFMQALLDKGKPKDILAKVLKDKDEFLKIFNPWQNDEGKKLIEKFVDNINKSDSNIYFSWLDILDTDKQWKKPDNEDSEKEVKDKHKHVNMRYQIPTHFHGDIDNAVIFHCMENPRGYLGSYGDNQIDGGLGETDLNGYYDKTYKLLTEDNSKRKTIKKIKSVLKNSSKSKPIQEIIQERYQLEENANKDISKDQIKNIIYSNHESALGREIEHMYKIDKKKEEFCNFDFENKGELSKTVLLKDYYYLKEYYSQLIQTNKKLDFKKLKNEKDAVKKIADKICNVEIYPFSCKDPKLGNNGIGREILLKSDLSRLGAYIVLRRIYRYLNDETDKPVIVLRKYSAWEELFKTIFSEVEKKAKDFNTNDFLKKLENNFFYRQLRPMGGGITSGNVISVADYQELKKDTTLTKLELNEKYLKMKDNAFKEISSLLPRIEVDKKR